MSFRCYVCDGLFTKMWGDVCNKCRVEQERHDELIIVKKQEFKNQNTDHAELTKLKENNAHLAQERYRLRKALEDILDINSYDDWSDANRIARQALDYPGTKEN